MEFKNEQMNIIPIYHFVRHFYFWLLNKISKFRDEASSGALIKLYRLQGKVAWFNIELQNADL
jgi:hypothetical protein